MTKKSGRNFGSIVESVLDLNANNIWSVDEYQIASMWQNDRKEENFQSSEEKLLNVMRLAFEVVHYNPEDPREKSKYENGEWATFCHAQEKKGWVAIRPKQIRRITDLSYENIKYISAATLLELVDRNFGGGWDSIPLSIKDIIESAFDISTTQLPTSRIHAEGGTLQKKIAAGYESLEIEKGSWTEAIFAKKKEPLEKLHCNGDQKYDEEGHLSGDEAEEIIDDTDDNNIDDENTDAENDEMYYSSYTDEATDKDEETEDGFSIIEGED